MPVLPSLVNHTIIHVPSANATSNATDAPLKVICAWPLSGQYGPGSRLLYYVLVATCVFARKEEWIRNACLAAALLFPAVAAIHAIVLAAVHVPDAVDMDIYGSFQLCAIGVVTALVTVRQSQTYFNSAGRDTIFLWTGLMVAGLVSLIVEFIRIRETPCSHDDRIGPISPRASEFPYDEQPECGLTCSTERGPFSPLRQGSDNDIYVIPAPDYLNSGAATLLAAACCVAAVLSLLHMCIMIHEKPKPTSDDTQDGPKQSAQGGSDGSQERKGPRMLIRWCLRRAEMIVLSAAVLTILGVGEKNFFSTQVWYQTEPMASIGQWSTIVGTALAASGSLYLLLAAEIKTIKMEREAQRSCDEPSVAEDQPRTTGLRRKVATLLISVGHGISDVWRNSIGDPEAQRERPFGIPPIPGQGARERAQERRDTNASSRSRSGSRAPPLRIEIPAETAQGIPLPNRRGTLEVPSQ